MPIFKIHHHHLISIRQTCKRNINQVKIFPVEDELQEVYEFSMVVTGDPIIHTYFDFIGNKVGDFNVHLPHSELSIDCRMTVKTAERSLVHESLPEVSRAALRKKRIHRYSYSGWLILSASTVNRRSMAY
jgi:hypothetical protein